MQAIMRAELAKATAGEIASEGQGIEIDWFFPSTSFGFTMHVTAEPDRYSSFSTALSSVGLKPAVRRVTKTETAWHLEVWVDVPEDWHPDLAQHL